MREVERYRLPGAAYALDGIAVRQDERPLKGRRLRRVRDVGRQRLAETTV